MARVTPTHTQLAALATDHLYYEIAMLRGALAEYDQRRSSTPHVRTLDRDDPERIACLAYFEVVLLHGRILDEFLVGPPQKDDVVAADYIQNWVPPNPRPLDRVTSVGSGLVVRDSINKQLAHFSLERLQQNTFYLGMVAGEVLADMTTFANDPTNTCHAELQGVRDLLQRNPWPTDRPSPTWTPASNPPLGGGS